MCKTTGHRVPHCRQQSIMSFYMARNNGCTRRNSNEISAVLAIGSGVEWSWEAVNNCEHPLVVLVLCVFGTCLAFVVLAAGFSLMVSFR